MAVDSTDCPGERVQQSEHSPGLVTDHEELARIIYHRDQMDYETGELKPGAFRISDLETRGLSLVRMRHIAREELQRRGEELAARGEENSLQGVGVATAQQVRSLRDGDDNQALCVLDDGQQDFPSHAKAIRSADQDRPMLKKLRGRLIEFFSPVRPIDTAMPDQR